MHALMLPFWRLLSFLTVVAIILFVPRAFAVDAATTISLGGPWSILQPYLAGLADVVIAAIIGWVGARIYRWTGITIEARHREALHSAAMTGVLRALDHIGAEAGNRSVDVRSAVIAKSMDWVGRSVPDALAYLGATPDKVQAIIESKLVELGWSPAYPVVRAPAAPAGA